MDDDNKYNLDLYENNDALRHRIYTERTGLSHASSAVEDLRRYTPLPLPLVLFLLLRRLQA